MACERLLLAIAVLATIGQMREAELQAQSSSGRVFEVASVKLSKSNERARINAVPASGRLLITGMTVKEVIQGAYGIQSFELVNADSPVLRERIDIEAKTEHPVASPKSLRQYRPAIY